MPSRNIRRAAAITAVVLSRQTEPTDEEAGGFFAATNP